MYEKLKDYEGMENRKVIEIIAKKEDSTEDDAWFISQFLKTYFKLEVKQVCGIIYVKGASPTSPQNAANDILDALKTAEEIKGGLR